MLQHSALQSMETAKENSSPKKLFVLSLATFGVGYVPIAPGTFGSLVGVMIYLAVVWIESVAGALMFDGGWRTGQITAWFWAVNLFCLLLFCLIGIWASSRASEIFEDKDPGKVVVDEVMGQLIVFLFIPFGVHWFYIVAGFFLFRLFDIWKPYPIDDLQYLPKGIGVCADDILAGIYAGIVLSFFYAVRISFN